MSEYKATVGWKRGTPGFEYQTYNRSHTLAFEGGITVPASAAPWNMPATAAGAPGVDPEQAFVASLSSCHMLWFLHHASQKKFIVERYLDEASGVLGKNAEGKEAMTRVTLRPAVTFSGTPPTPEQFAQLHEKTHQRCCIANSVKTEIILAPRLA